MSLRKITLPILGCLLVGVLALYRLHRGPAGENGGNSQAGMKPSASIDMEAELETLARKLEGAGWPLAVAGQVVRLNRSRYEILIEVAPEELNREISKLARLKVDSHVKWILERDPSVAGLLCLANQPQRVAECLLAAERNKCYEQIKGSFVLRIDGWDIDAWSAILTRHGELAGRLIHGGIVQPELLLNYPLDEPEVADAYGEWLEDTFQSWPNSMRDGEFDRRYSYAARFGGDIREKMRANPEFRRAFSATIWPTLLRLADQDPGILFAGPEWGVWDLFLERPDAQALLERSGIDAADLLAGENSLPEQVHDEVASYLLAANLKMLDQIDRYRDELLVVELIERKSLGPRYLPDLFAELDQAGSGYPARLRYFASLSEQSLLEELDPIDPGAISWVPGYSTYALIRKSAQGRAISGMDVLGASLDVVDLIMLATPVKGASGTLQKMVREAGESQIEQTARMATNELGERAAKEMTKAAAQGQLTSKIGNGVLGKATEKARKELLSKGMIDITPLVQKGFQLGQKLQINRESFKKITGLEARVFMRGDGRVYLSLPELIAGRTKTAAFLNRSAILIAENSIGGEVAEKAMPTIADIYDQHIAAWWLAHAADGIQSF